MRNSLQLKAIGSRMREARELAGYSQIKAAKLLGYRNSSRLNKIENGTDVSTVSLDIIIKGATLYDVSTDFLLVLSNDWERDAKLSQSRDIASYLMQVWTTHHERDINAIRQLNNKLSTLSYAVTSYEDNVDECTKAIKRFAELNPTFENEMRGGSRLLKAIQNSHQAVFNMKAWLRRFKADCAVAGNFDMQVSMFSET